MHARIAQTLPPLAACHVIQAASFTANNNELVSSGFGVFTKLLRFSARLMPHLEHHLMKDALDQVDDVSRLRVVVFIKVPPKAGAAVHAVLQQHDEASLCVPDAHSTAKQTRSCVVWVRNALGSRFPYQLEPSLSLRGGEPHRYYMLRQRHGSGLIITPRNAARQHPADLGIDAKPGKYP